MNRPAKTIATTVFLTALAVTSILFAKMIPVSQEYYKGQDCQTVIGPLNACKIPPPDGTIPPDDIMSVLALLIGASALALAVIHRRKTTELMA